MNVVDSSGWLEYFADGPNASFFAEPIEDISSLIVPTISLVEVFKKILLQKGETEALNKIAVMHSGEMVDLTTPIALHAAKISADLKIPMADSIMLATAREQGGVLWTQDSDFKDLDDVRFVEKKT